VYVEKGSRQVVCGSEEKGGRVEMDFTCYKKEKKIRRIRNRSCMFSDSLRLCTRLVFALFGHMHTLCLAPRMWIKNNPTEHHNPQKKGISTRDTRCARRLGCGLGTLPE